MMCCGGYHFVGASAICRYVDDEYLIINESMI